MAQWSHWRRTTTRQIAKYCEECADVRSLRFDPFGHEGMNSLSLQAEPQLSPKPVSRLLMSVDNPRLLGCGFLQLNWKVPRYKIVCESYQLSEFSISCHTHFPGLHRRSLAQVCLPNRTRREHHCFRQCVIIIESSRTSANVPSNP